MDRDDSGARAAERQRVLRVHEVGTEPAKQPRQRPGHPQLLTRGRELDRLDPRRDELGVSRHGGDAQPGGLRRLGERSQHVEDVGLVAGTAAAENIRIDDDERGAHASSRQSASTRSAELDQPNACARSSPSSRSSSRRESASAIPAAMAPASRASTSTAAPPATSSVAPPLARHDRCPARHRLEHRQPEPLVERGEDEAAGAAVERRELVVRYPPGPAGNLDAAPAGRADDPQLDVGEPRGLDGPGKVLARLEGAHGEHVVAGSGRPVGAEHGLDTVGNDADPLCRDVEELDQLVTGEGRDGDHRIGVPGSVAKRHATRVPMPGRERIGVPEQGAVVDRDDDRQACAERPAHRRAVKHVGRTGLVGNAERVPSKVANDGRRTPMTVEADPLDLELRPALDRAQEALHDAGGAGPRLGERSDIEGDLHDDRASS